MPDVRALAAEFVRALAPYERALLADDPFVALKSLGFGLRYRNEPAIKGDCSVAASLDKGPPPLITVVTSASVGRQRFSVLHEYGHWLIANDTSIHDVFFDQRDGGVVLEEDLCDAIAAELLIPTGHVDAVIGAQGPTAASVVELIDATPNASVEACCVRAAERLNGPGHVMIARNGIAQFTASHSTPYRVRRGTPQGDSHITVRAAEHGRARLHDVVVYASGSKSNKFFADAVATDSLVIAVFMENRPPWVTGLALPADDPTSDTEVDAYCTHCEFDFVGMGSPCRKCHGYFHRGSDGCGKCACTDVAKNKLCSECFVRRTPGEFTQHADKCDVCLGV